MVLKKKKTLKRNVRKKVIKRKIAKKKKLSGTSFAKKTMLLKKTKKKESVVGIVTHYFPKVRAAVIKLKMPLTVGDTVKIKGHTTDFTQNVTSIQINRVPVNQAKKGKEIGLLVDSRVRRRDIVYKA